MNFLKKTALFCLGGGAYVGLELLWRGRSHWSMFAAGGLCFLLIGEMGKLWPKLPLPVRMAAGAGIITLVELATGLLVNQNYQVWDYRQIPGNFLGQICPAFTALWVPVSGAAIGLYHAADRLLEKKAPPAEPGAL